MYSVEFLALIQADREREITAAHRVRLLRRDRDENVTETPPSPDAARSVEQTVRPPAQSGRPSTDPSL